MVTYFRHIHRFTLLALIVLLLTACGTIEVGLEQDAQEALSPAAATPEVTAEALVTPAATESPEEARSPEEMATAGISAEPEATAAVDSGAPSPLWSTYRDPEDGFGYAFPCHWIDYGRTLSSYDEMFFLSRGIRGHWAEGDPPTGAIKVEIAAFDYADSGIEPGTSLEEAVPLIISDNIVSMERVSLGSREALRVNLDGQVFPSDQSNEIYFFERTPESTLILSVNPRGALTSADVQGIVDSLALTADEEIKRPARDPEGRLEGREVYADQEAGFCFQYPAEYTLEAYPPSGIPYLGDIATLKLERPFYTLGLTATALRIGEQSTLEEWVSQYISGLSAEEAANIERNPAERVGGVAFQVGQEPAEYLEGMPGADGSRDIYMKHEDRLYRLSFIPSIRVNPQAEGDLESLFLTVTTSFSFLPLEN